MGYVMHNKIIDSISVALNYKVQLQVIVSYYHSQWIVYSWKVENMNKYYEQGLV